ncbi:MAG TPA: lytic transglycosylase domain-containing protein [Candidatus Acidoferrum sp.]|nr:lytic transglycosylase domain-containing protein [Candidatus Acidoferrum sp.]
MRLTLFMRARRHAVSENVAPRLQPGIFDFANATNYISNSLVCTSTAIFLIFLALLAPQSARAEYVVLKSGQRLVVTGYQLVGDTYKLQLSGGSAELPSSEVVAIEPEEIFHSAPKPQLADIPFANFISSAAQNHGVDADLIVSVIAAESKFNPKAVSRKNARGLMQLLPETAARLGVKNIFDPRENIEGGTKYLRELLDRYGNNLSLTLAAYNAGPQRIDQFKTIPPYSETISYVRRVQKTYDSRKKSQPASACAKPIATPETKTGG